MPTAKPAFDAALDTGNALTTGIEFASWCVTDPANPTRLTDVSGNGLHGTLTNLAAAYEMDVTGGTGGNAAYNQTYSPAGTENGRTKYLSADSNYKLSYFYMMDPSMDGAWYLWAAAGTMPWMDGYVSTKAGDVAAEGGSYSNSFAVAQGDLAPGPWFDDGLELTTSPGYVSITTDNDAEPGTNDFSVVFDYTYTGPISGQAACLFWWSGGGKAVALFRWPANENWATPILSVYINDGTTVVNAPVSSSGAFWAQDTRVVGAVTFNRDGYARVFADGTYLGQADISSAYRTLSDMGTLLLGTRTELYPTWSFGGRLHTVLIYPSRLLSDAEVGDISDDIYALASNDAPYNATGTHAMRHDAINEGTTWNSVSWTGSTPAETGIRARLRAADTTGGLATATWSDWVTTSGTALTGHDAGRYADIEFELSSTGLETPQLDLGSISATYHGGDAGLLQGTDILYSLLGKETVASGKMLGRASEGAGAVEEIATTGTGNAVLATSPTLVTPVIGTATGTSLKLGGAGHSIQFAVSNPANAEVGMTIDALGTQDAQVGVIRLITKGTGADNTGAGINRWKFSAVGDAFSNASLRNHMFFEYFAGATLTNLMSFSPTGGVGIGNVLAPTGSLHLPAGTTVAATAPLKLTSGALLSTPEAGAVEFLTDAFYATITTGAARKTFAFLESPSFVTRIATPSIITASGALTITPASGSGLTIALAATGDLVVNTTQLVVDTSAARVGFGTAAPLGVLHAQNTAPTENTIIERIGQTSNNLFTSLKLCSTKTTDMGDGIGSGLALYIQDDAAVMNLIATIGAVRAGADNTGDITLRTVTAGATAVERLRVMNTGTLGIGTTTDGLTAAGSLAIAKDLAHRGTLAGFFNTAPAAKPTVTGSRGGNAALASLLTGLAGLGLITDSSSA